MEAIMGVGLIALIVSGVLLKGERRPRSPLRELNSQDIARAMSRRRSCECNALIACRYHSQRMDDVDCELSPREGR